MERVIVGVKVTDTMIDLVWEKDGETRSFTTSNESEGYKSIIKRCPANSHFIMEAKGGYYRLFAVLMHSKLYAVSVVNSPEIKRFMYMADRSSEREEADAYLLCRFGNLYSTQLWAPLLKINN